MNTPSLRQPSPEGIRTNRATDNGSRFTCFKLVFMHQSMDEACHWQALDEAKCWTVNGTCTSRFTSSSICCIYLGLSDSRILVSLFLNSRWTKRADRRVLDDWTMDVFFTLVGSRVLVFVVFISGSRILGLSFHFF